MSNVSSVSYGTSKTSNSLDVLSEVLFLPKPKKKSKRGGLNSKAICITDNEALGAKEQAKKQKLEKQEEREKNKFEKKRKSEGKKSS